jgi:hypothetical protein
MPYFPRARRVRVWLFLATTLAVSGCALISGLDGYEKGDAEAADVVVDQTTADAPKETGSDTGAPDTGNDVVLVDVQDGGAGDATDAGDASDVVTTTDAGDCGVPNTIKDCTMCGASCDGTNALVTGCNGTTCQYTCKQGFSNCSSGAPDLNGCECATPVCCGTGCGVTHMNGVGQNYYDCVDAGTYDQTQAGKACTAYTNNQFACQAASCIGDAGDLVICGFPDGGGCACWDYAGQDTSHVYKSGTTTCYCPGNTDPTWN